MRWNGLDKFTIDYVKTMTLIIASDWFVEEIRRFLTRVRSKKVLTENRTRIWIRNKNAVHKSRTQETVVKIRSEVVRERENSGGKEQGVERIDGRSSC